MGEGVTRVFDLSLADGLIDLAIDAAQMLSAEPICYFVIAGLISVALGLFGKARGIF